MMNSKYYRLLVKPTSVRRIFRLFMFTAAYILFLSIFMTMKGVHAFRVAKMQPRTFGSWSSPETLRNQSPTSMTGQRCFGEVSWATPERFPISGEDDTNLSTSSSNIYPGPPLQLPSPTARPIRYVMAPMVASSDYAFRELLRQYQSADLCFTQMIHAQNLIKDKTFRKQHLDLYEYQSNDGSASISTPDPSNRDFWLAQQMECVYGQSSTSDASSIMQPSLPTPLVRPSRLSSLQAPPLIAQLAGNDVDTVVQAAHLLLDETRGQLHGIDINLGCPQGIARKGRYGAFLMEQEPDLVYRMLRALRESLPQTCSVSAKIRLPLEEGENPSSSKNSFPTATRRLALQDRIHRLIDTGINFITVHGRTLRENKTAVGACHVDAIRRAVEAANQHHCPIIANGGIETFQDAQNLLRQTGACAVMSSEGLLEVPNVLVKPSYPCDIKKKKCMI